MARPKSLWMFEPVSGYLYCLKCEQFKPPTLFWRQSHTWTGRHFHCIECQTVINAEQYLRTRFSVKDRQLRNLFNISQDGYDWLLAIQGGVCAICRGPEIRSSNGILWHLQVDHDHRCCPGKGSCGQCIRGPLCAHCNTSVGNRESNGCTVSEIQ